MQIYWTLKQVPELAGASRSERVRRWRAAYRRSFRHWETWAGLVVCVVCAEVGAALGDMLGTQPLGGMVGTGIGGGVGGLIFSQVVISVARRHYKSMLLGA